MTLPQAMNTLEKIEWMAKLACMVSIDANDNRGGYRTVAEDIEVMPDLANDYPDEETRRICIERNFVYVVSCYPSTPVGSYCVRHHDLAAAIDIMFGYCEYELQSRADEAKEEADDRS